MWVSKCTLVLLYSASEESKNTSRGGSGGAPWWEGERGGLINFGNIPGVFI